MSIKIYTRGGDDGTTGLFGGGRTDKDAPRIAACGDVDELNAALGLTACCDSGGAGEAGPILHRLQGELFELGANLATPADAENAHIPPITQEHIDRLEREIDAAWNPLPPMRHFILPGGSELAAHLHLARAVCRRTERTILTLSRAEPVDPLVLRYVNRLSDLLFALARHANHAAGVEDVPWKPETSGQQPEARGRK